MRARHRAARDVGRVAPGPSQWTVSASRRFDGRRLGSSRVGSSFCFVGWSISSATMYPSGRLRGSDLLDQHAARVTSSICPASSSPRSARSFSPRPPRRNRCPARDLLEFPLGLLAEAPALSMQMTGGLWNPATGSLRAPGRAAFGFAGAHHAAGAGCPARHGRRRIRIEPALTAALSIVKPSVSDIHPHRNRSALGWRRDSLWHDAPLGGIGRVAAERDRGCARCAYRWGTSDSDHRRRHGVRRRDSRRRHWRGSRARRRYRPSCSRPNRRDAGNLSCRGRRAGRAPRLDLRRSDGLFVQLHRRARARGLHFRNLATTANWI